MRLRKRCKGTTGSIKSITSNGIEVRTQHPNLVQGRKAKESSEPTTFVTTKTKGAVLALEWPSKVAAQVYSATDQETKPRQIVLEVSPLMPRRDPTTLASLGEDKDFFPAEIKIVRKIPRLEKVLDSSEADNSHPMIRAATKTRSSIRLPSQVVADFLPKIRLEEGRPTITLPKVLGVKITSARTEIRWLTKIPVVSLAVTTIKTISQTRTATSLPSHTLESTKGK